MAAWQTEYYITEIPIPRFKVGNGHLFQHSVGSQHSATRCLLLIIFTMLCRTRIIKRLLYLNFTIPTIK